MTVQPDPKPRPLDHLLAFGQADAPALILRDGVMSYADLREAVARLASWLQAMVPAKGARVASWAAKGKMTCLLPLAAARAGLVHVPINPLLKRGQVAHILADCDASLLIANATRLNSLTMDDRPRGCLAVEQDQAWADACQHDDTFTPSTWDEDELCAILYTSGSTGKPKGVMLSHANLWLGAVSVAHYLGLAGDDVVLAVLPLSFDYGQNQLFSAWRAGASVVPLDYLVPRDVIKACARHGVTTLAAVPPLWGQLTAAPWPPEAVQPLRRLTNSGGALGKELVQSLRRLFPDVRLFSMYGLTEAFRSTFLDPDLVDTHPHSIGRAIPFAEVLVIDDDGKIADAGKEGELVHCGPLVAQGYWRDPARSAERFRNAPQSSQYGGIAVWSGDRVMRDEDGLLYFIGRRDEMIKSAGIRISPQEIEEAALATGLCAEAVALGVADQQLGQIIHLMVRVARENVTPQDISRAMAGNLPNFMLPKHIHLKDRLPINANGKIDRTRLRQELTS